MSVLRVYRPAGLLFVVSLFISFLKRRPSLEPFHLKAALLMFPHLFCYALFMPVCSISLLFKHVSIIINPSICYFNVYLLKLLIWILLTTFLGWKINFWSSWNELISFSYIRPTKISINDSFRRTSIHCPIIVFKHHLALMYLFVYKTKKVASETNKYIVNQDTALLAS
jgi:hypothetical protein